MGPDKEWSPGGDPVSHPTPAEPPTDPSVCSPCVSGVPVDYVSLGQSGGDDIDYQQGDFPSWDSAWGPPGPVAHHHSHRTGRWAAGAAGLDLHPVWG